MKFVGPPKIKLSDIRKNLGRFRMRTVTARITVTVSEKKGSFWADDIRLSNPPRGREFRDLLGEIKAFLEKGKSELVLDGILSEDKKEKPVLTLTEAGFPRERLKR